MNKYEFTEDMEEISGFGGGYEAMCRSMVIAGLEWCDANPDADPQFVGYKGIYGIISEENEAAKKLTEAVLAPTKGDCTGAMHQASIGHIMWIQRNGWEKYCAESKQRKLAQPVT